MSERPILLSLEYIIGISLSQAHTVILVNNNLVLYISDISTENGLNGDNGVREGPNGHLV